MGRAGLLAGPVSGNLNASDSAREAVKFRVGNPADRSSIRVRRIGPQPGPGPAAPANHRHHFDWARGGPGPAAAAGPDPGIGIEPCQTRTRLRLGGSTASGTGGSRPAAVRPRSPSHGRRSTVRLAALRQEPSRTNTIMIRVIAASDS
jgi:hypothetical protein